MIEFLKENWSQIIAALTGLVVVLEIVASWTSTEKDDKVVSVIKKWVAKIGGLFGKKEEPKKPEYVNETKSDSE